MSDKDIVILAAKKNLYVNFFPDVNKIIVRDCGTPDEFYPVVYRQTYTDTRDNLQAYRDWETDRKSTRLNSSHITRSRMPSSA